MNGFLVVDKSKGISSFDVVRMLRRITGVKKIGHCGTLDPMATGVLVVAIGEATKLIEYLLGASKRYVAEVTLGGVSDTFDAEGEITEQGDLFAGNKSDGGFEVPGLVAPSLEKIKEVLAGNFIGEIDQVPPKYSALKIAGKKAYELARSGVDVEMQSRKVFVEAIEVLEYEWPKLRIDVKCGKGTYIRSLANDLGAALGCGGYLSGLRRTEVSGFGIDDAEEIEFQREAIGGAGSGRIAGLGDVQDSGAQKKPRVFLKPLTEKSAMEKRLIGLEAIGGEMSKMDVREEEENELRLGRFLMDRWGIAGDGVDDKSKVWAAFCGDRLVGVVELRGEKVKLKKGINY